ncbi:hypothetical protein IFM89_017080 [Coptis chinensis]|uniref:Pentatricopeptide repeat-containing protein n=1 Tax=Coptis chinensis TaxID=261450 RepID=A0A835IBT8_9MAGN|nr:hypothetical protein IFM89_017080 [Coptis chinensis]
MQKEHGVKPGLEHYTCMGALLGACRNHGNVELAEIAAKSLYELDPASAGSRLLLLNLYTNVRKRKDAEKLKKMMKSR